LEHLYRNIQADAESLPREVLVHLDLTNAFGSIRRDVVASALCAATPDDAAIVDGWVTKPVTHYWYDPRHTGHMIHVDRGVDQGCPLSVAGFAAGFHRGSLERIATAVVGLGGCLRAYLDDVYIRILPDHVDTLMQHVAAVCGESGLELNRAKTEIYPHSPEAVAGLSEEASQKVVDATVILGALLDRASQDDARQRDPTHVKAARFLARMEELTAAGLSSQAAVVCLRSWLTGALTHMLRLRYDDTEPMRALEAAVRGFLERTLGQGLDAAAWRQATLPLRLGGLGLPDLATLPPAAFLGSLGATLHPMAAGRGVHTPDALRQHFPRLAADAAAAGTCLGAAGAEGVPALEDLLGGARVGLQKELTAETQRARADALRRELPADRQAWLRSCSGAGAGAWLQPPRSKGDVLARTPFNAAVLLRLGMIRMPGPYAVGLSLTDAGDAVRRHNAARDCLANWLTKHVPAAVRTEQSFPELGNTEHREGRMDIGTHDATGDRILIDVVVTHAAAADEVAMARAAQVDGAAAAAAERRKRARYPQAVGLVPFALETGGRPGAAARGLVRRLAPTEPALRTEAIGDLWQSLGVVVQRANALRVLALAGH